MNKNDLFFNSNCRALIIGSTGSIGRTLVTMLKEKIGVDNVETISRFDNGFNLLKPETIATTAEKQSGEFQLILDATGALEINGTRPEKTFKSLEYTNMVNHFKINAIGPALIIKHFMNFLPNLQIKPGSVGREIDNTPPTFKVLIISFIKFSGAKICSKQ